ncbi:MAG: hypothetical protein DMF77_02815 [Acidobacteria bacterium]|nr:MAG: hypothetical protein DMF77_02815 [Acidobacteriota bacterium]
MATHALPERIAGVTPTMTITSVASVTVPVTAKGSDGITEFGAGAVTVRVGAVRSTRTGTETGVTLPARSTAVNATSVGPSPGSGTSNSNRPSITGTFVAPSRTFTPGKSSEARPTTCTDGARVARPGTGCSMTIVGGVVSTLT